MCLLAAEMRQNDKITCILEDREKRDRKNLCKAINDFQQSFQKPETRREFDLSDPLALKKDVPARQSDSDVRNTISGMQKFMGEDLNFYKRKKFQQEQNREWSLQQQREWKNTSADQNCAGNETRQTDCSQYFLQQSNPFFSCFILSVKSHQCVALAVWAKRHQSLQPGPGHLESGMFGQESPLSRRYVGAPATAGAQGLRPGRCPQCIPCCPFSPCPPTLWWWCWQCSLTSPLSTTLTPVTAASLMDLGITYRHHFPNLCLQPGLFLVSRHINPVASRLLSALTFLTTHQVSTSPGRHSASSPQTRPSTSLMAALLPQLPGPGPRSSLRLPSLKRRLQASSESCPFQPPVTATVTSPL